jgi:hypothetical protein
MLSVIHALPYFVVSIGVPGVKVPAVAPVAAKDASFEPPLITGGKMHFGFSAASRMVFPFGWTRLSFASRYVLRSPSATRSAVSLEG